MEAERPYLGETAALLHDPAAVIAATEPEVFCCEDLELAVRVEAGAARGQLNSWLDEAIEKFPEAVNAAVERMVEQAREMQRQEASRIVVPGQGLGPKISLS